MGDHVRISQVKKTFKKGYVSKWREELFTIHQIKRTVPVRYLLIDDADVILKGSFYEQELQKVIKQDQMYCVEAILEE